MDGDCFGLYLGDEGSNNIEKVIAYLLKESRYVCTIFAGELSQVFEVIINCYLNLGVNYIPMYHKFRQ